MELILVAGRTGCKGCVKRRLRAGSGVGITAIGAAFFLAAGGHVDRMEELSRRARLYTVRVGLLRKVTCAKLGVGGRSPGHLPWWNCSSSLESSHFWFQSCC